MKKGIIITLILIILAGITGFFVFKNIKEEKKEYSIAEIEEFNYFLLKENNKIGVIDNKGNIVIEPQYDDIAIPNPEKDIFICYQENKPTVLNSSASKIFTDYENIEPIRLKDIVSNLMYEKTVLTYTKDEKKGLIDINGNKIIDNKYESIEALPEQEGKLLVKQDGKVGIININGYELVKNDYDQIQVDGYYEDKTGYKYAGYIVSNTTNEGYRYGYINYNGEKIIEPVCNELSRVSEIKDENNIYLILAVNGQYGVYKNKDQIIKNEYQSIYYEQENQVFVVEKTGKYGVINLKGEEILPVKYNEINITGIGIYAKDDTETKVFDKNGNELKIDEETSILNTDDENYQIKITNTSQNVLYGVIDKNGKDVIPPKYKYIDYLQNNYFIVSNQDGKLGIINDKDEQILELKYDSLQKVTKTNIIQAVNENTTELYTSNLEKICELSQAKIKVKDNYIYLANDEEIKYVDIQAEKEIQNTEIFSQNTLFAVKENEKWGFADKDGNKKIDCKYEKVTEFNEYGYAGIKENGQWGVINSEGQIITEPTYEINKENEEDLSFIGQYYGIEYSTGEIYYTKGSE